VINSKFIKILYGSDLVEGKIYRIKTKSFMCFAKFLKEKSTNVIKIFEIVEITDLEADNIFMVTNNEIGNI